MGRECKGPGKGQQERRGDQGGMGRGENVGASHEALKAKVSSFSPRFWSRATRKITLKCPEMRMSWGGAGLGANFRKAGFDILGFTCSLSIQDGTLRRQLNFFQRKPRLSAYRWYLQPRTKWGRGWGRWTFSHLKVRKLWHPAKIEKE